MFIVLNDLLAEQQNRTYQLDLKKVQITLNAIDISTAVGTGFQKIDCDSLQNSLVGFLSGFFTRIVDLLKVFIGKDKPEDDILWPVRYRKDVRDNISQQEDKIKDDVEEIIHTAIESIYLKNNRFDLDNQIISAISDDIKKALYLR